MPEDLHALPKIRDSWSYLYVEHAVIEHEDKSVTFFNQAGKTQVPAAAITLLMLGPGTNISHAAIHTLAASGCLVVWCGEEGVRFYAEGMGETRSARNLLRQARLCCDQEQRLNVVRRMYQYRFEEPLDPALSLQQIRGREGMRVRATYARASRETGVPWEGRTYRRQNWSDADPVNRALSAANSCLYGICHAAIVAAGYSPALGFVHTGKMLSFVYDIADLYKADLTIPVAFRTVAAGTENLESRVRRMLRDSFHETRLLQRIIPDIELVLGKGALPEEEYDYDTDDDGPGGLWDPQQGQIRGGVNRGADDGLEEV